MHIKLLPFLEEDSFYGRLDMKGDVVAQLNGDAMLKSKTIPVFRCPSDDYPLVNDNGETSCNYAPSQGAQHRNTTYCAAYSGNHFGTGPSWDGNSTSANEISGLFSRYPWSASFRDIADGTSHTIAMGEIRPACSTHLHLYPWWHGEPWFISTATPINFATCPNETPGNSGFGCNGWANWNTDMGFKSRHPGGAQFVFADGSVHFLAEEIDYVNYQRLGCRRDGQIVEPF